jgi:hypothetical protein
MVFSITRSYKVESRSPPTRTVSTSTTPPRLTVPYRARSCSRLLCFYTPNYGAPWPAVQLGQHRLLIDSLASTLSLNTLFAITAEAIHNLEVCSAFSVYFTMLEQICHWPRDKPGISTPKELHDYKLVVQVLHEPELRTMLENEMDISLDYHGPDTAKRVAQAAFDMAERMLCEARESRDSLSSHKQDHINLLYRTCRND